MKKSAQQKLLAQWRGYRQADAGRPVRAAADIVPFALQRIGLGQRYQESSIREQWKETMGDFLALHTRPAGLQRGVLTVEVDHSAFLHEISLLHKKLMVERLRVRFPELNIRDVKLRLRG